MDKDPGIFLHHILESIDAIERYVGALSHEQFIGSEQVVDAVVRRLEVIGEATRNISTEFKKQHSDIPWRKMGDLRNVLIHEYFYVDTETVWEISERDLPSLRTQIAALLSEE